MKNTVNTADLLLVIAFAAWAFQVRPLSFLLWAVLAWLILTAYAFLSVRARLAETDPASPGRRAAAVAESAREELRARAGEPFQARPSGNGG